jgi:toxin ParE1/3/4
MLSIAPTLEAQADLTAIWRFIANHNLRAADAYCDQIQDKFALLAQMPELGTRLDIVPGDVRYFTVGNHVIFYRVQGDSLQILRVLHGARDFSPLLE